MFPLEGAEELSPGSKCFRGLRWASLWSKNGLVGADTERSGSTHSVSSGPLECSFKPSVSRQHRSITSRNRSRLVKA